MSTVLTIDQGTSGTKAVVVDECGAILGLAERPVRPTYLLGSGVEQDPQQLLESVLECGREAAASTKTPIDIVTIANQGETVLAWDPETGAPLSNMVVWQDRRAESVCAELAHHGEQVAGRTGLVLDSYFSAPKMAWLRKNVTTEGVVTTSDSWLVHQLTGEFITDPSTASRSLLLDVDSGQWDLELLGIFGLGNERLPRISDCDTVVGHTSAFGREIAVGGLVVDQQAALLGEGCLQLGEAKCTFGTGAFLLVNTGSEATRSTSGLATSIAWRARGETTYCLDGQVYAAASAVRWMEQLGYISHAADMDAIAAPDAEGVLAIPSLAGLGAPWWRPDATASVTGMTLSTEVGHIVTAVLHGIAAQVATLAKAVEADMGRPLARLRVDGGLTQSRTLMQAVSDLLQMEIDVFPSAHATPLGAAALARMALDPQMTIDEAVIPWTPRQVFTPAWSAERAGDFLGRWNEAVKNLTGLGARS